VSEAKPTIFDVAEKAGVSKSLVALALAGSDKVSKKSREKIISAAEKLGYRPNLAARSLAAKKSKTIGVQILDLHNPVFAEILDGVQSELRDNGYSSMLVTGVDGEEQSADQIDTLLQFQIDGLILISHRLSAKALAEVAAEVPTVTVTRDDIKASFMDTVCNDDEAGAALAVDHLVSLGHKRIVCLTGGEIAVSRYRAKGYKDAMRKNSLEKYIVEVPGGLTDSAGFKAATKALELNPTALFVANDIAAIGAMAAVEDAGLRVPEDISIVGYDGIRIGGLRSLNLTTVAQPLAELGKVAAQQVLERIENPKTRAKHPRVNSQLVVRGTTARV
jgi:DNA-binding LacI/PurR family transcriptional regulator